MHRVHGSGTVALILTLAAIGCDDGSATIVVHPDSTYQTIVGWESHSQSGESEVPQFPLYAEQLFDMAVDSFGINRLRVEAYSSMENSRDYWTEWRAGALDGRTWRCVRFATEDDNGDPEVIDWDGFHFSQLDHTIEKVVLPIKQR
ncbi:MAG: hypothetical protein ACRELX_07740, partial [Longimicrobiales bacterium]